MAAMTQSPKPCIRVVARVQPAGRCYAASDAAVEDAGAVRAALARAIRVEASLDAAAFASALREAGLPEERIERYLRDATAWSEAWALPSGG